MKDKNILFLMCDQLNPKVLDDCIRKGLAPNFARLQARSARFSTAYCATPLCTPSRASIVTGLYPHQHCVVGNIMRRDYPCCGGPETEEGIRNSDLTTEKILWQKGWRTGHVGKWHLLGEDLAYYPTMYREHYEYAQEMEETFRRVTETRKREDYMNWYGWKLPVEPTPEFREAADQLEPHWKNAPNLGDFYTKIGPLQLPPEDTFDYRTASKAIEFLNVPDGRPFMLTCSFNAPHDPNVVSQVYYDRVRDMEFPLEADPICEELYQNEISCAVARQGGPGFLKEFIRVYYGMVLYIDDQIGRVLDALEASGKADDTIVVFMADHGDMAGGHGMFWKCTIAFYDEIARVPFWISAPGQIPAGSYDFPAELVDLMPTLLELCGQEIPQNLAGHSLIPYCLGQTNTDGLTAFSERLDWNAQHTRVPRTYETFSFMLRDSRYKYLLYQKNGRMTEFLYDMAEDPGERVNLVPEPSRKADKLVMRRKLLDRLAETNCSCNFHWETLENS